MALGLEHIRANMHSISALTQETVGTSAHNSSQLIAKPASPKSSSCPQSVSPHLPPTPPSSRSPPSSRLSPSPPQNEQEQQEQQQHEPQQQQQQQRVLPFSIANILRPDFGNAKNDYDLPRPQSSRSPDTPDIILRTPPKTPDTPGRHDSPVDLSHKNNQLHLIDGDNKTTNERLLSHSINFLINPHNHAAIHPLQHHLQQQLLQHHNNSHLQHPIISKPIPLSTSTAFQLFKPLSNFAEHQKRIQQQQLQQQLSPHQKQHQQHSKQQQQPQILLDCQQPSQLKKDLYKDQQSPQQPCNKPLQTPMSIPSPTPSTCSTISSCSSSSISSTNKGSNSNKNQGSTESIEELVNPKIPEDNTNWPAWVYCTRYSDRPSSGKIHN